MLNPCPKNSASPSTRLGSIASAYSPRWTGSGASTTTRSASSQASYGVTTRNPSASALARLLEPSSSPTRTSTPESRSDNACACPWLPYPSTATLRPWTTLRSAWSSYISSAMFASVLLRRLRSVVSLRHASCGWADGDGRGRFEAAIGDRAASAVDRHQTRLDELADAERLQDPEHRLELVPTPRHLDRHRIGRHVDHLGTEESDRLEDLSAGLAVGADLDESELALDRPRRL